MIYSIFTIEFDGAFRFSSHKGTKSLDNAGMTLSSDGLFSALVSEGVELYGKEFAQEIYDLAYEDNFLISDLLPCKWDSKGNVDLFIPRPKLSIDSKTGDNSSDENFDLSITNRKKLKKIDYLPIGVLNDYINYMKNRSAKSLDSVLSNSLNFETKVEWKNSIEWDENQVKTTLPFTIATNRVSKGKGFYFVLGSDDDMQYKIENIINSLQYTGIGGKKSIGYGKFSIYDDVYELNVDDYDQNDYESYKILAKMLSSENSQYYMSLSSVLPNVEDFNKVRDKSYYSLSSRSGFVSSLEYSNRPLKKKSVVMIDAGSCFPEKIKSKIIDVRGDGGAHEVYRMGKALMLGVDIDG